MSSDPAAGVDVGIVDAATRPAAWLGLRRQLWPHCTEAEHLAEMAAFVDDPARYAQSIALDAVGKALGLVEAALRRDHVNGTDTSPVAFLEGIFVVPEARRSGVARALVAAVAQWAVDHGCTELASDAAIGNTTSHATHAALGFVETERVVFFRKVLQ